MSKPRKYPELEGVAISDTSIRQPVFITMVMLLFIVLGLLSYFRMPVNLYPDFEIPVVGVQLLYPGASPDSVAEQVSEPVEDALVSISGVKDITSSSYEGAAMIVIEFESGVSIDVAEQDVRGKVNAAMPRLPMEVEDPLFFKFDPGEIPVISLAVFSKGDRSSVELRRVVEDDIVPFIQRIQGVGSVSVSGGQQRQINVLLDLNKMQTRQILPSLISHSIRSANINLGLGDINAGELDVNLRAPSMLNTPQDITRIQIAGTQYRIGDVATIEDGIAEVTTYARLNGEDAINVSIIKRPDANVVEVAHEVKHELEEVFGQYSDLEYFIPLDTSTFVEESVHGAIEELFVASIAAMIVVFIFFRSIRNTLVTIIGLPVILIGTFAAISLFGLTINVITLMALSLSVGLVIDDAIVVRENIFRHTEMGEHPIRASSLGTAEVSLSVVAMTLTVIAVFLPVTFTTGITGIIFKSFGITVACAMAISLVEAFTLAPMTSAHLFQQKKPTAKKGNGNGEETYQPAATTESTDNDKNDTQDTQSEQGQDELEHASPKHHKEEEEIGWMGRFYGLLLRWSLRHRFVVVVLAIAIFVLSVYVAAGLKFAFFPATDQGEFYVGFELPPGTPLEKTNDLSLRAEALLMEDSAVDSILATVGSGGGSGVGGGGGTPESGQIFVKLKDEAPPTEAVIERLRTQLDFLPTLAFGQEGHGSNSSQVTGREIQLEVNTNRPFEEIIPFLLTLREAAKQIDGVVDVDSTYKPGKPELHIIVDPSKIGDIGITNDDLANSVRTLINGSKAGVFRKDGEDVDINVRLRPGDRASIEDIRNINIPTMSGSVPIGSLVQIKFELGPTTIRRQNRVNQVIIGANVTGRNTNEVLMEMQQGVKNIEVPQGVKLNFGGDTEEQAEGFVTMLIAMALSVLFVYMVLASQFGSFLQPFVIMLAMPFSFLGSFLALRLVERPLDMISMIGLVMLMGLVVKNSILLIDFTNRLRDDGLSKHEALEKAGMIRLRPILMTSIALIAGATPVAIGIGEGAEIRQGLSTVVIGGMITSTMLTLLVVPTAYSILEGIVDTVKRILRWRPFRRKPAEPAPHAPAPATPEPRDQRAAAAKGKKGDRERSGEGATVAYATTDES
jgi:hydrophobic/amphiphilic exporter-1 (mainly G- bacteria), HAE1 family